MRVKHILLLVLMIMSKIIIYTSVAVEVLGVSTRVGHRSCTHAFLHVDTHKVISK